MRNPDGNRETEGALPWGAGGQFLGRTLFGCFGLARRDLSRSSFAQDDVEDVGCRHVRLLERHPEGALSRPEDIRLLKSHSERPTNSERRESKNLFESSGSRPWGSSPPFFREIPRLRFAPLGMTIFKVVLPTYLVTEAPGAKRGSAFRMTLGRAEGGTPPEKRHFEGARDRKIASKSGGGGGWGPLPIGIVVVRFEEILRSPRSLRMTSGHRI